MFDSLGAMLMVGTRFRITRKFGLWLFPKHSQRVEGYQKLLEKGEIHPGEPGFMELREALFPTGNSQIFTPNTADDAEELFSDKGLEPVKIEQEEFRIETLDGLQRRDLPTGIVSTENTVTRSEVHYIAEKYPNTPNLNSERRLRRSFNNVDTTLERDFKDDMLHFGAKVLMFGFILQLLSTIM